MSTADLVRDIDLFLADHPIGKPHTGYRYGELLVQARDKLNSHDALVAALREIETISVQACDAPALALAGLVSITDSARAALAAAEGQT